MSIPNSRGTDGVRDTISRHSQLILDVQQLLVKLGLSGQSYDHELLLCVCAHVRAFVWECVSMHTYMTNLLYSQLLFCYLLSTELFRTSTTFIHVSVLCMLRGQQLSNV